MSVDTKGFVATPCKNVFFIAHLTECSLNRLIRDTARAEGGYKSRFFLNTEVFSSVDTRILPNENGLDLQFKFRGQSRNMKIWFDCDGDHQDYADRSISVNLGAWGSSALLTRTVLEALSCLGPVYLNENDAVNDGYERLTVEPMNYVQAAARNIVTKSIYEFKRWQVVCPELRKPFDRNLSDVYIEFLGFTVHELNKLFSARDTAAALFDQLLASKLEHLGIQAA